MSTELDIERLELLFRVSSQGEWKAESGYVVIHGREPGSFDTLFGNEGYPDEEDNHRWMAEVHNKFPQILEDLKELKKLRKYMVATWVVEWYAYPDGPRIEHCRKLTEEEAMAEAKRMRAFPQPGVVWAVTKEVTLSYSYREPVGL